MSVKQEPRPVCSYNFPEARNIVVCGDIHGDFKSLVNKCCVQYHMTDTLIVVAGDCGFGFRKPGYYEETYSHCRARLAKANNWVVFVRGNHDNPAYFDGRQVSHKRWLAVPDYTVLEACGHTILCVGGAISIDRGLRMESSNPSRGDDNLAPGSYWQDEPPVFDPIRLGAVSEAFVIDTLITHTAPSFCEKTSHEDIRNWLDRDKSLYKDMLLERQTMDSILDSLKGKGHPLRCWFYGHFHQSWHARIDEVHYHLLDVLELRELR